jgi:hypothetical protein
MRRPLLVDEAMVELMKFVDEFNGQFILSYGENWQWFQSTQGRLFRMHAVHFYPFFCI